jgi:hypothetical protein
MFFAKEIGKGMGRAVKFKMLQNSKPDKKDAPIFYFQNSLKVFIYTDSDDTYKILPVCSFRNIRILKLSEKRI